MPQSLLLQWRFNNIIKHHCFWIMPAPTNCARTWRILKIRTASHGPLYIFFEPFIARDSGMPLMAKVLLSSTMVNRTSLFLLPWFLPLSFTVQLLTVLSYTAHKYNAAASWNALRAHSRSCISFLLLFSVRGYLLCIIR